MGHPRGRESWEVPREEPPELMAELPSSRCEPAGGWRAGKGPGWLGVWDPWVPP